MAVLCSMKVLVMTLLLLDSTTAQQPSGSQMHMAYPGISDSCGDALNTTVDCPRFISSLSVNDDILDTEGVTALCVDDCYSSLENAKSIIAAACTASSDVIVHHGIRYPATLIIDSFLFSYNTSCRKDSSTGDFCDPQILEWSNQSSLTSAQHCSDCWLGTQAVRLGNPLGYDDSLASDLAHLTSSCSTDGYSFATPTAYALNHTTTSLPPRETAGPPPTCTDSYTVREGDECNSVAQSLNVSTYNLLYQNNLDLYCQSFATKGTTLCIPPQCQTYTWQASDTCNSVVGQSPGITVPQFLAWNPNFNQLCQNSINYIGYQVCLGPPGGFLDYGAPTNSSHTGYATVAQAVPTNARDGSSRECGDWYTIIKGDTCSLLSLSNSISLGDLYFLNPSLDETCTNLLLGVAYCVEAVGAISTYSGYSQRSGPTITVPPVSFQPVSTIIATSTNDPGYMYTPSYLPVASGTIQSCKLYVNYDDGTTTNNHPVNDCLDIAYMYGLSMESLIAWNPSLSRNLSTCALQPGGSYCVQKLTAKVFPSNSTSSLTSHRTERGTTAPSVSCANTSASTGSMNMPPFPIRSRTGTRRLQTGTMSVQIGIIPSRTGTIAPQTSTALSQAGTATIGGSVTIGPTPTGIVPGCRKFYTVQAGDSCDKIERLYKITLAQFYSWNPSGKYPVTLHGLFAIYTILTRLVAVEYNCECLWSGYAYCVEGPP